MAAFSPGAFLAEPPPAQRASRGHPGPPGVANVSASLRLPFSLPLIPPVILQVELGEKVSIPSAAPLLAARTAEVGAPPEQWGLCLACVGRGLLRSAHSAVQCAILNGK